MAPSYHLENDSESPGTRRGIWQYFRILDDRLIEIRADGTPVLQGVVPGVPLSCPVSPSESRK
ncbi:MAG: hypothetical protein ABSB80_01865 [Methanoregula sp.]|uniref:hypothetical protein n=1 Tax=Methanoregula sp. TaxID=2052170 RepID=UPI003D131E21